MRKSSPSFCQDTPDKESRRRWEVIMIVLTGGKDASSAYCLTTALYCPLPGQYRAIARHKTIRRERNSPLSFLLFTLHQIAWNPDKHRGSERWRVVHHSSPLFTTLHLSGEIIYLWTVSVLSKLDSLLAAVPPVYCPSIASLLYESNSLLSQLCSPAVLPKLLSV